MSDTPRARLRLPASRIRRRRERSRAQALVEFAIILPVFLFLVLMAVDFGRLFFTYVQVSNAAREAASYGAVQPTDEAGMQVRAAQEKNSQTQAGESPLEPIEATCHTPGGATIDCADAAGAGGAGNILTVTVSEDFAFITPLVTDFFGGVLRVSADASSAVLVSAVGGGGTGGPSSCSGPTNATFTVFASGMDVIVDPAGSMPDTGVCTISGYNWDFGDGVTDVGSSIPTNHTYASPGTYVITLEVTNQGGALTAVRSVTVPFVAPTPSPTPSGSPTATPGPTATATPSPSPTPTVAPCAAPVADFTWRSGSPRRNVTFTDTSTAPAGCPITNWLWEFRDTTPSTFTNAQNPFHAFPSNNGSYVVVLTVTSSAGSVSITKTVSL
jgi:Flp pilus assembly protein TadG